MAGGFNIALIVGILLSKFAKKSTYKFLNKLNIEQTVLGYTSYSIYIICLILTVMMVLSILGIPGTTILSIVSIAGVSIGLAFKEILSSLGSGYALLFLKPFKIGDYIEFEGIEGTVANMHILNTTLKTFDNKTIIIPNSKLINQNIINYTKQDIRRVDILFNLDYGIGIEKIESIITPILNSSDKILKEEKSLIGIRKFKEFNMEILVTAWVSTEDYWDVYYFLTREISNALNSHKISMKTIQDINVRNQKNFQLKDAGLNIIKNTKNKK